MATRQMRKTCLVGHVARAGDERAEIIVVAPPALCETANTEFAAMFAGRVEQSKMVASFYRELADEAGVSFFDAGSVCKTSPLDGVHVDAEGTKAIGVALVPIVRLMLGL